MEVADQYERSAEFVDVMIAPHWAALAPSLSQVLRDVTGPIVDVGAGGGQGTRVIAEAVPEAEIVAVEPSAALRSVLLARVNESAELRDRVTVLPEGFLEAALPQKLGAVVAMNVIGHFDPVGRQRIWSLLAERLVPGGRAVLNLQPPTEPMTVPESRFADVRVGRRRYEGWGRAGPAGPDRITWHITPTTMISSSMSWRWPMPGGCSTSGSSRRSSAGTPSHRPPPVRPDSACISSTEQVREIRGDRDRANALLKQFEHGYRSHGVGSAFDGSSSAKTSRDHAGGALGSGPVGMRRSGARRAGWEAAHLGGPA
ncbi:class I SAM-dependent methyltransferase [Nonomuraea sp. NPDC004186]